MPVNSPNKIEFDIDQIDIDIVELTEKIDALTRQKDFLSGVREYALTKRLNGHAVRNSKPHKVKKVSKLKRRSKPKTAVKIGISEFIVDFLKGGQAETKKIIEGWANETGQDYDKVSNNISNALNRLKGDKIDGEVDSRGKRYGATWFLKK